MSIFLDDVKLSVKCHRNRHDECRNKQGKCGCMCHVVQQKNEEKRKSDIQILDDYICGKWRSFWRPFLP